MPAISPAAQPAVPPAHGSEITDYMLEKTIEAAQRIEANQHSNADAALFMVIARPAMEELLQWRRRMEVIADLAAGNVLMFPGGRG